MQEIVLSHPYPNGTANVEPEGQAFVDALNEMERMLLADEPVYIKFLKGDRAGSIARFEMDHLHDFKTANGHQRKGGFNARVNPNARVHVGGRQQHGYRYEGIAHGVALWDGRRNKIKVCVPHGFAWLKGYEGPTVWEKFDAKAAKKARLDNPQETDIDGKLLAVGDKVLYINSRYGSGSELCHGKVIRFDATRDTTFTIVQQCGTDMESKIQYAGSYIWKQQ